MPMPMPNIKKGEIYKMKTLFGKSKPIWKIRFYRLWKNYFRSLQYKKSNLKFILNEYRARSVRYLV